VRIPMEPAVESLNAATSAALLLYHLYRSGSRRSRRAES
jgi:tRNA G18 (ribose-2'-O)-methylase SpoU